MNLKALEVYGPDFLPDKFVPAYPTSFASCFQRDKSLAQAFQADKIDCIAKPIGNIFDHSLFGRYEKGWYKLCIFYIGQFPGCCGAVIVHDMHLTEFTHRAFEKPEETIIPALVNSYEWVSYALTYTSIMTTELEQDPAWAGKEYRAYSKAGWKPLESFVNRRTSNKVTILWKDLTSNVNKG